MHCMFREFHYYTFYWRKLEFPSFAVLSTYINQQLHKRNVGRNKGNVISCTGQPTLRSTMISPFPTWAPHYALVIAFYLGSLL
jgi:hypothetical protein